MGKSLSCRHAAMRRICSSNSCSPSLATAAPSLENARRGRRTSGAAPAKKPSAKGEAARAFLGVNAMPDGRVAALGGLRGSGGVGGLGRGYIALPNDLTVLPVGVLPKNAAISVEFSFALSLTPR